MKRIIILGPGGSGKSTLARDIGKVTGIPVTEIDKVFWQPGLAAMPREQWIQVQRELIKKETWIMEGDLGPYDVVEERLKAADTIIFMDLPILHCAWRVFLRGKERADFWWWLLNYRRKSRPVLLAAIAHYAPHVNLQLLRSSHEVQRFIESSKLMCKDNKA